METTAFRPLYTVDSARSNDEESFRKEVLNDYYICCVSREASILARKEVLTGKAKFGITGDGKEVIQVALAKALKAGDHRAGYYRDQTLMFALGISSVQDYFAQLYADSDRDPFSKGRQMMTHFATPYVDEAENWRNHMAQFNTTSDVSCTAGQMGRAVGLALASKKFRALPDLGRDQFSQHGNEVVMCSIGDGSTSEGAFWEAVNASAVMQVPIAFCVWDDGYAISVPTKYQTVKASISRAMEGFLAEEDGGGVRIYTAEAKDYAGLCDMFIRGFDKIRKSHCPALFHVQNATQPLGHSTSGSQERYKSKERLDWELEQDCIRSFGEWIERVGLATESELKEIRLQAQKYAKDCKKEAWMAKTQPIKVARSELVEILQKSSTNGVLEGFVSKAKKLIDPELSELQSLARQAIFRMMSQGVDFSVMKSWNEQLDQRFYENFGTHLYSRASGSLSRVSVVDPIYDEKSPVVNGYEVLNHYFKQAFRQHPNLFAFGEDVGRLGDVNQGLAGMQQAFGDERVFDTGIREWTIVGQAIGMAMRGLRPIAEIQYLDYIVYAMAPLTDDLATLSYRSAGIQKAPALIRTRGHRLEGIWHTGSPMGLLLGSLRGMHVLVPRNMVQAAGMYQTWLGINDPVLMIECLNGYRQKERLPVNLGEYTVPYGVPEVLREGSDVTLVTYGACIRIAQMAAERLATFDISVELIDVQTLMPFDTEGIIVESLKKTNKIIFVDEDVPGGATAFMLQQVIEKHQGFNHLDLEPRTLTAKDHRPPYGSDGDYYAKPNAEDIFEAIFDMMYVVNPQRYQNPT